MYSYLFSPPIFHDPSFHCSLFLIHICELLLLMSYSFSVSPYVPFPFLRFATPPANASSAHPRPVFVVYHYRVSPMYIHCHHHFVLTSFFFIMLSLTPFVCLSTIILSFFFSFCLVFLSCGFLCCCAPDFFLMCAQILLLYIYTTQ
jgi:hypothetical protein